MNKKVFYLHPQVEGKQEFVCFGVKKAVGEEAVRAAALNALEEVKSQAKFISQRSFSVLFGQDHDRLWVAVPRVLATKVSRIFNDKLSALDSTLERAVTSDSFAPTCAFYHGISYDRGFIVDGQKLAMIAPEEMPLAVSL